MCVCCRHRGRGESLPAVSTSGEALGPHQLLSDYQPRSLLRQTSSPAEHGLSKESFFSLKKSCLNTQRSVWNLKSLFSQMVVRFSFESLTSWYENWTWQFIATVIIHMISNWCFSPFVLFITTEACFSRNNDYLAYFEIRYFTFWYSPVIKKRCSGSM